VIATWPLGVRPSQLTRLGPASGRAQQGTEPTPSWRANVRVFTRFVPSSEDNTVHGSCLFGAASGTWSLARRDRAAVRPARSDGQLLGQETRTAGGEPGEARGTRRHPTGSTGWLGRGRDDDCRDRGEGRLQHGNGSALVGPVRPEDARRSWKKTSRASEARQAGWTCHRDDGLHSSRRHGVLPRGKGLLPL
jgi:hypothetical protein